jgi:hypothetical protein
MECVEEEDKPTVRRKIGCPTKLTEEAQETIIRAVRMGNFINAAAGFAGVTTATVFNWLRIGKTEEIGPHHNFFVAVRQAEAEAEARCLAIISMAAQQGDWKAAAWLLERRFPKRWSIAVRVKASLKIKASVEVGIGVKSLTDEELQQRIAEIEADVARQLAGSGVGVQDFTDETHDQQMKRLEAEMDAWIDAELGPAESPVVVTQQEPGVEQMTTTPGDERCTEGASSPSANVHDTQQPSRVQDTQREFTPPTPINYAVYDPQFDEDKKWFARLNNLPAQELNHLLRTDRKVRDRYFAVQREIQSRQ